MPVAGTGMVHKGLHKPMTTVPDACAVPDQTSDTMSLTPVSPAASGKNGLYLLAAAPVLSKLPMVAYAVDVNVVVAPAPPAVSK